MIEKLPGQYEIIQVMKAVGANSTFIFSYKMEKFARAFGVDPNALMASIPFSRYKDLICKPLVLSAKTGNVQLFDGINRPNAVTCDKRDRHDRRNGLR